jgi:hypothetical protein
VHFDRILTESGFWATSFGKLPADGVIRTAAVSGLGVLWEGLYGHKNGCAPVTLQPVKNVFLLVIVSGAGVRDLGGVAAGVRGVGCVVLAAPPAGEAGADLLVESVLDKQGDDAPLVAAEMGGISGGGGWEVELGERGEQGVVRPWRRV